MLEFALPCLPTLLYTLFTHATLCTMTANPPYKTLHLHDYLPFLFPLTVLLQFDPSMFQWFYSCVQQKKKSGDLYNFVVQFSLDIILVYFYAVYENQPEVSLYVCVFYMYEVEEKQRQKLHNFTRFF